MHQIKKQYEKPMLTDQGSLVDKTRATPKHEVYDGNPGNPKDNQMKGCIL